MQARHTLEDTLTTSLNKSDVDTALETIATILSRPKTKRQPSLDALDDKKQSFFSLALKNNLKEIAIKLFELQKDNDAIIFGKNNEGFKINLQRLPLEKFGFFKSEEENEKFDVDNDQVPLRILEV